MKYSDFNIGDEVYLKMKVKSASDVNVELISELQENKTKENESYYPSSVFLTNDNFDAVIQKNKPIKDVNAIYNDMITAIEKANIDNPLLLFCIDIMKKSYSK